MPQESATGVAPTLSLPEGARVPPFAKHHENRDPSVFDPAALNVVYQHTLSSSRILTKATYHPSKGCLRFPPKTGERSGGAAGDERVLDVGIRAELHRFSGD